MFQSARQLALPESILKVTDLVYQELQLLFFIYRAQDSGYLPSTQLLPIFSQSKINECHADITYPTLYNWDNILNEKQEQELLPWALRKDTLFFRGATTGRLYLWPISASPPKLPWASKASGFDSI